MLLNPVFLMIACTLWGTIWLQFQLVFVLSQNKVEENRPFSPSVPAEAGCLLTVAAGVHVFISVESLHCFLVGWCTNKSYVIATSDL